MMNVIALMGRLVKDPELRKTPNGVSTCTITIACERSFVKQGEERQADFIDIVTWRNTAEFLCKYFLKGQLIAVNGSLQTRTYQDKNGNNRKVFEVIADNLHFAEKNNNGSNQNSRQNNNQTNSQPNAEYDDFSQIDDSEDLPF